MFYSCSAVEIPPVTVMFRPFAMLPEPFDKELSVCPALVEMLSHNKTVAADGSEIAAHSMSTLNNLFILKQLFTQQRPATTLEVGLGHGASCVLLAALHQAQGGRPQSQHIGIDPFQTTDWKDAAPHLLQRAGLSGYFQIFRQRSSVTLPALVQQEARFGLIYVDGSHLFEDVFVDFYFCRQLLPPGGIIAFDDCSSPHISKVLKFIDRCLGRNFTELDLGPLRADGGKNLRYRIAKLLGKTQMRAFRLIGDPVRAINSDFITF